MCLFTSLAAADPRASKIAALSRGGTTLCRSDLAECTKRCEAGNARSCSRAHDLSTNEAKRSAFRNRACELGDPRACAFVADAIDAKDHARATTMLADAC